MLLELIHPPHEVRNDLVPEMSFACSFLKKFLFDDVFTKCRFWFLVTRQPLYSRHLKLAETTFRKISFYFDPVILILTPTTTTASMASTVPSPSPKLAISALLKWTWLTEQADIVERAPTQTQVFFSFCFYRWFSPLKDLSQYQKIVGFYITYTWSVHAHIGRGIQ